MPPRFRFALLPLTVVLVRVMVPTFEMPATAATGGVIAHGTVGKSQCAAVADAAASAIGLGECERR